MQPEKDLPQSGPSSLGGGGRRRRRTPDREVPIYREGVFENGSSPTSAELMNRWLDGEVPDSAVLATADGDDTVDLWNKIHDEAELLRNRTTPLYVHKRIMDSLPNDLYQRRLPWYRRPIPVNPLLLILLVMGLVGVGVVVARMLIR